MPDRSHDQPEQAALAASLLELAAMTPAEIQLKGAAETAAVRTAVEGLYTVEQGAPGRLARYVARSFGCGEDAAQDRVLDLLLYHLESTRPTEAEHWPRSRHLYWPARRLDPEDFRLAAQVVYLLRAGHLRPSLPVKEGPEGLLHQPGPEEFFCAEESRQEQHERVLARLEATMITPRKMEVARQALDGGRISEIAKAMNRDESVVRKHIRECCARLAAAQKP